MNIDLSVLTDSANAYIFVLIYMPQHVDRWFTHSVYNDPDDLNVATDVFCPRYRNRLWMTIAIKKHLMDDLISTDDVLPTREEAMAEMRKLDHQKPLKPEPVRPKLADPESYLRFYRYS